MLAELRIVNFALIEQLHIEFKPGFTVLTGETGAGKSLLIDAIGLLVGGRASTEQIRSGEDEAQLEASFHLPIPHPLLQHLRKLDLIGPQDQVLILRRILSRSGRHRAYINGSLCPLRVLEELGGTLVDMHGQHEQQSLLVSARQLDAVDAYGELLPMRERYAKAFQAWNDLLVEIEVHRQAGVNRDRMVDLLRFQAQEIEQAELTLDEESTLQAERQRLVHAHRLRGLVEEAYQELQRDDQGVLVRLGRIGRLMGELERTDPSLQDCGRQVQDASIQLKDVSVRLRDYTDLLEADPNRQGKVEDRLDLLQQLKKKYGGSIEAVVATGARVREELESMEAQESRMAELEAQQEAARRALIVLAKQLSKKRCEAAMRLTKLVVGELAAVKMEKTAFDISVDYGDGADALGPAGLDRVEFLLSSNVGEPLRPLGRIASGGELSRVMLALKTILADTDHVPVLVFDEIDAGVGGAVAAAMGKRLRMLGAFHQVFCITHLPQVASQAEHHILVEKGQDRKRTTTSVRLLNGIGREEEIARMLGGATITKKIRETAAELIAGVKEGGGRIG